MTTSTYIQQGDTIDHTPAADVAEGQVVVQNDLIGVAVREIKAGETGALALTGIFECFENPVNYTFAVGDRAYWDTENGGISSDSTTGPLIGKVTKPASSGESCVRIRLSQ